MDQLDQLFQRIVHRLFERHVDSVEQFALQHPIDVLRHAGGGGGAMGYEDRPAVRAGVDALAVMAALFEEQAQPDHLGGRALDMQQIVDLLAQQSGVIVFIFAAIEDQARRV